ncbi:hypothetical protein ASPWEDRAFT_557222 [Aspergillus wentii DTO 134E9]|uniref:Uncharacterized protein n=1 Tax=Aspergillus wentii DTO 134E9 TaxID=1073089 RepID=A0A1L9RGL2_ASPWE|nr:uncharacterized protein ASPWEDRAFT_557222 [Aspergillus wentii DTO 134E9]OJJ34065.1 hypothetical protein ASPWEDRAFT_557222 [Aspergillus wentii DTO 134E9]
MGHFLKEHRGLGAEHRGSLPLRLHLILFFTLCLRQHISSWPVFSSYIKSRSYIASLLPYFRLLPRRHRFPRPRIIAVSDPVRRSLPLIHHPVLASKAPIIAKCYRSWLLVARYLLGLIGCYDWDSVG